MGKEDGRYKRRMRKAGAIDEHHLIREIGTSVSEFVSQHDSDLQTDGGGEYRFKHMNRQIELKSHGGEVEVRFRKGGLSLPWKRNNKYYEKSDEMAPDTLAFLRLMSDLIARISASRRVHI